MVSGAHTLALFAFAAFVFSFALALAFFVLALLVVALAFGLVVLTIGFATVCLPTLGPGRRWWRRWLSRLPLG